MAFKAFFVFYISLHFASFHNDAIVKGNNLNLLISERKQETPLKRVLTEHGDTYDCINVYEQPSLKHPLLRNHRIQMRPSHKIRKMIAKMKHKKLPPGVQHAKIKLDEACPKGTIPVLRVVDKDLSKNVSNLYKPQSNEWNQNLEFAGIFTQTTPDKKYQSNLATISVYNPQVGPHQYSSAAISVEAGNGADFNQIQIGWTVYPDLFNGDTRTHWYFKMINNGNLSGCYNLNCLGFVQTNTQVAIGTAMDKVSKYSTEDQVVFRFSIIRDEGSEVRNASWWLVVLIDDNDYDPIGYFPATQFNELAGGADKLQWGGYVLSSRDDNTSPPMGSGHFDNGVYQRTCFMSQVELVDHNFDLVDSPTGVQTAMSRCYLEGDESYKNDGKTGYSFCFGGTGGSQSDCEQIVYM